MIGPHKVQPLSPAPIRDHRQARLQAEQEKKSADFALRAKLQSHYDQQAQTVGAMRLPTPHPLIVDELPILSPEHQPKQKTESIQTNEPEHQPIDRLETHRPKEVKTHDETIRSRGSVPRLDHDPDTGLAVRRVHDQTAIDQGRGGGESPDTDLRQRKDGGQMGGPVMSTRSDSIKEIATALAKAQAVLVGAVKDSVNPHFKTRYADLASCWDACRKALTSNGIAVVQMPEKDMIGYYVETLLTHSSGEWIASKCYIHLQKDDPQGLGSAITYARRYGLSAMVGISAEDDDAELAQRTAAATKDARGPSPVIPRPAPVPARVANPVTGLKKPEPIEHAEERDENDDFVF